jgi:hypothetical protein
MLLKSTTELDENELSSTIQDSFQTFLKVNMKIRPNDTTHNNIRTIEPSLIKYTDSLYQFIIKVSAYTVLKYEYSELALYLNKAFNLPIGSIVVEKLNKDETIKVEIPAQPKQYENEFYEAEEEITEQDVIVESDPILEKKIQIKSKWYPCCYFLSDRIY